MFRSASLFIGTSFTVAVFTIFATSDVDSIVGIPHKIYSMQNILIHIKTNLFVKCAHLHPGYAENLVARSWYYHCHWTVLAKLFPVYRRKQTEQAYYLWVLEIRIRHAETCWVYNNKFFFQEELVNRIKRKLETLQDEKKMLKDEISENNSLGKQVCTDCESDSIWGRNYNFTLVWERSDCI